MIDIESSCRICLEDGAIYHIFNNEHSGDIHNKIAVGLNEKIEDIAGYPHNICTKCKDTIESICDFKTRYKQSCTILKNIIVPKVEVKIENDTALSDNDIEGQFNLEINKELKLEPDDKLYYNNDNILKSLKEITIKKLNDDDITENVEDCDIVICDDKNNVTNERAKQTIKNNSNTTKLSKEHHNNIKNKTFHKKVDEKLKNNPTKQTKQKDNNTKTKKKPPPRLCDLCGQTFNRYSELRHHKIEDHHINIKDPYKCNICSRTYLSKSSLKEHTLKSHEKIKKATCDDCGSAFYGYKELNSHIKVVHKNIKQKKTSYKCKFCDKSFTAKRSIVCHERSVHTGERPAICSVCNSAFFDIVYLREHMRLHTGEAPFKCPICNRGYAQRGNMKSHMRNHRISELKPDILSKLKPSYFKFLRP